MIKHYSICAVLLMLTLSINAEPLAVKEPLAIEEPSAIKEHLADRKPLADKAKSQNIPEGFSKGPIFLNYGANTVIDGGLSNAKSQQLKVVFDIADQSDDGGVNRKFDSVARFINMHARAGVPLDNLKAAIVVHGKASFDLMNDAAYQQRFGKPNANSELLSLLLDAQVNILICGQSAHFLGLTKSDLRPEVQMSLSAMTANALLQQQNYTLNPF